MDEVIWELKANIEAWRMQTARYLSNLIYANYSVK